MDDLSNTPDNSVLSGFITEADLARQMHRSVRTLQRLAAHHAGPPRIKIGRLIYYRVDSVREWLAQLEQPQRKLPGSVRTPSRRRSA